MFASVPIWVYAAMLLLFFSGFMALRAAKAERQLEKKFIEKEGNVYIERMEAEREARMHQAEASKS